MKQSKNYRKRREEICKRVKKGISRMTKAGTRENDEE
jgi:hypothetical protein